MLGLQIGTLVIVCLHLAAYLYLNFWAVVQVKGAISRQDDRIRRRLERASQTSDEDMVEQLVDGIRDGYERGGVPAADDAYVSIRERYPDARLPEEL